MYRIYDEQGSLIQTTDSPQWQAYDQKAQSFYCVAEEDAKALLIVPETEGADSYYANIQGIEEYSWLTKTVRVVKL